MSNEKQSVAEHQAPASGRLLPTYDASRILFRIALIVSVALMAVSLFKLPGAMEHVGLDWSWSGALGYFTAHGFRFGPDVLYTYGPLGFLQADVNAGVLLRTIFIAKILEALTAASLFGFIAWQSRSWIVLLFITLNIVYFGSYEADSIPLAVITILTVLCISVRTPITLVVITAMIGGCLALIKFTYFLQIAACFSLAFLYLLLTRQARSAAILVGTYLIALLAFWTLLGGQPLTAFPSWIRGAWEIAAGFNQAMFVEPSNELLFWGILEIGLLIGFALLHAASRSGSYLTTLTRFAILCGSIFIIWKQGYVRADFGHALVVPLAAQILAPFLYAQTLIQHRIRFTVAAAIALLASVGVSYAFLDMGRADDAAYVNMFSPLRVLATMEGNVWALRSFEQYRDHVKIMMARAGKANALPKLSQQIKTSTVDVFGDEIGIAILNHWNYRPRPVFQSFSAYTKYLLDRNAHYVISADAPDFYLLRLQPIDQRLATAADGSALRAILCRYEAIDSERGYLLFRKRKSDLSGIGCRGRVLRTGNAEINHPFPFLPIPNGALGLISLNLKPSLSGQLRAMVFHPAQAMLRVTTQSKQTLNYRLLPNVAGYGIIIDPPIRDVIDLHSILQGTYQDRVTTLEVRVDPKDAAYFQPEFRYSIEQSPGPAPSNRAPLADLIGFGAEPVRINSPYYPRLMVVDDQDVLFAHAPSSMVFNVPDGATKMLGAYGVMPGAFQATQGTKSIDFTIVATENSGTRTLFHAILTAPKMRHFEVALPKEWASHQLDSNLGSSKAAGAGQIELRFSCSPGCDGGWTYWKGVSFTHGK